MELTGFLKKAFTALLVVLFIGQAQAFAQEDEVKRLIEREEYGAAQEIIQKTLGEDPKDDMMHYYAGVINFQTGKVGAAQKNFQDAIGYGGRNPYGYIGMGSVNATNGNYEGAKENLEKAKEVDKKQSEDVLYLIAQAWLNNSEQKFLNEAEVILVKMTAMDPNNAKAYIGLGDLYDRMNVPESALYNYESATKLQPDFIQGWLRVGQIKKKMEQYNDAAEAFTKAMDLDPNFPPAYKEMGEMWILAGKIDKAREMYSKYLEMVDNDVFALRRYAVVLFLGERYQEALDIIKKNLQGENATVISRRIAFYCAVELGNVAEAEKYMTEYQNNLEDTKKVYQDSEYEGRLLALKGDHAGAIKKMEEAYEMTKTDGKPKPEYLEKISEMYKEAKDYGQQARYLDQYLNTEGVALSIKGVFDLGRAYYFSGSELMSPSDTAVAPDTTAALTEFMLADSAFAVLTQKKEDLLIGWAWRGRANAKMDPGSQDAKALPYYERVLEIVGDNEDDKEKYKRDFMEAHRYIGAYFTLVKEDCETALVHWNAILSVDPENEQAKQAIDFCNQ